MAVPCAACGAPEAQQRLSSGRLLLCWQSWRPQLRRGGDDALMVEHLKSDHPSWRVVISAACMQPPPARSCGRCRMILICNFRLITASAVLQTLEFCFLTFNSSLDSITAVRCPLNVSARSARLCTSAPVSAQATCRGRAATCKPCSSRAPAAGPETTAGSRDQAADLSTVHGLQAN
jgi:hypothetical protein